MKAIMVMFDTLNRRMLEPYGCDWINTPNFNRLAQRAVTFDCNYVGSLPCMPARRELHTGRYNFLHRSWGPMEPFDDSMPELLRQNGVYTHICTDHQHYWEDGGASYLTRYSSAEFSRGQEGDPWKVDAQLLRDTKAAGAGLSYGRLKFHDRANRQYMNCEERMPQAVTFAAGLEFMEQCHQEDDWFLTIETFDPHEPFYTQPKYKEMFKHDYTGPLSDWPPYYMVTEGQDSVDHMRLEYAALMTMCDDYLGKVLDKMDEYDLWADTMLIVNTDHGYLLGEHGWWAKSMMPIYEEIARTPLFVYDPRNKIGGQRRGQITQTIDLAPTLLEFFDVAIPKDMQGKPLRQVVEQNQPIRSLALFGDHHGHCNATDGRWVYMKAPVNHEFYDYTLMPTHMRERFAPAELQALELAEPFSFTKGCKVLKIKADVTMGDPTNFGTKLFDLAADPAQAHPVVDLAKETELANQMLAVMRANDCPPERFAFYGLPAEGPVTEAQIATLRATEKADWVPEALKGYTWEPAAVNMYHALARFLPAEHSQAMASLLHAKIQANTVTQACMMELVEALIPAPQLPMAKYFILMSARVE